MTDKGKYEIFTMENDEKKSEKIISSLKPHAPMEYKPFGLDLLDCRETECIVNGEETEKTKSKILETLSECRISDVDISCVKSAHAVTKYYVTASDIRKIEKIKSMELPLAFNLNKEDVRIFPDYKNYCAIIEVPNEERNYVTLGSILKEERCEKEKSSSLTFVIGKDTDNNSVFGDISKMIHILVAGSKISGKTTFIHSMIHSLTYKYSPEQLRFILIDLKNTEFGIYKDTPHLLFNEIVTEADKALNALDWAIEEMNRRYQLFYDMSLSGTYVVNVDQYNGHIEREDRLPKIVIVIDELAELMCVSKKETEEKIQQLTQKSRPAGIHLVAVTEKISKGVITSIIKNNIYSRIVFAVPTESDSCLALEEKGAEHLLKKGDCLYQMQGMKNPLRVQGAFISASETEKATEFLKKNNGSYYDETAAGYVNKARLIKKKKSNDLKARQLRKEGIDETYIEALRTVITTNNASVSFLQRKFSMGYNKAGMIIEWMEDKGYITPFDGAKARTVLITKEEFEEMYGLFDD